MNNRYDFDELNVEVGGDVGKRFNVKRDSSAAMKDICLEFRKNL
jgi:hypothetical protein